MKEKKSKVRSTESQRESSSHFQLSSRFSAIENRSEYEKRLESHPPEQQELVKELTNFADLCKHLEDRGQKLDGSFADAMKQAAGLPIEQRVARIRQINQKLIEGVEGAGEGPQFRH